MSHKPGQQHTAEVCTIWYRAPEIVLNPGFYNEKCDLWSVGCIFAEMLGLKALFEADSEIDLMNIIFQKLGTPTDEHWPGISQVIGMFPVYPPTDLRNDLGDQPLPDTCIDLIYKLLTINPDYRISAKQALAHLFFAEFHMQIGQMNVE